MSNSNQQTLGSASRSDNSVPAHSETQPPPPHRTQGSTMKDTPPPNPKKRKGSDRGSVGPGVDMSTDVDDDNVSVGGKVSIGKDGKRTRVHFSCVECHRRKQKCDRKEPCSQCVARRVPHLCRPFLNGVEDPNSSDVQARLTSIESLLGRLVSALPQALTAPSIPNLSNLTGGTSDPSSPDVSSLQPSGEEIFHPRSAPMPDRQTLPHKPPPSGLFPTALTHNPKPGRTSYGWGLREGRMISLSLEENIELRDVLNTLKESGLSKGHLEWLIAGVPGRRMADGLVELYFRDIDWTRYKLNKPSFMRRYETFFDSLARNPSSPRIDAETLKWLPLMFIVLAIATLSATPDLVSADEQAGWSRRFYGSARSGLEYAKALQRDNLDVLFAGLLASRYMLLTRRPAEGSTPLTTAFQLGLYRDGTVLNLSDKREVEIRRRAWAMLYHLDRTISLLVGRPASISDAHTDTRPPANLDDEELESDFDPAGHPLTRPTVYTYIIVRHKLAEIMGRIAYHTFAIQLPDYTTVLNLDRELIAWRDALPPFFTMDNPDTSLDKDHPYLFVQRHLLACEWYYTRITLNRPYLLRRKPQDGRYAYSKNAAIESATADLLYRRSFIMEKGNVIVNSGGYRVLNSYMVLGVTIKLDPESPQADELRHLLNVVSGRAPDKQGRVSEPLVKEELAIVEFLTAKATASSKSKSGSSRPSDQQGDQTPVDLLLNLAKTRSGRRAAEEEKRQLRLQQYREVEEQRRATSKQSQGQGQRDGMASPWGYQAPQMPGLDVQQPFASNGMRKVPRPLAAPSTKRDGSSSNSNNNSNININGDNNDPWNLGFNLNGGGLSQPQFSMSRPSSSNAGNISANSNAFPQLQGDLGQLSFPSASSNNSFDQMGLANLHHQQQLQLQQHQHQQQNNVSPESLFGVNVNASDQNSGQSQQQQTQSQMDSMQLFGNAMMDQFDFSDLGLGSGVQNNTVETSFNPFALAQAEDATSEGMSHDDETQFLNYILTKIANSQPEVQ